MGLCRESCNEACARCPVHTLGDDNPKCRLLSNGTVQCYRLRSPSQIVKIDRQFALAADFHDDVESLPQLLAVDGPSPGAPIEIRLRAATHFCRISLIGELTLDVGRRLLCDPTLLLCTIISHSGRVVFEIRRSPRDIEPCQVRRLDPQNFCQCTCCSCICRERP